MTPFVCGVGSALHASLLKIRQTGKESKEKTLSSPKGTPRVMACLVSSHKDCMDLQVLTVDPVALALQQCH